MFFSKPYQPVLSPCIGICRLDAKGLCEGCHRSVDEIANWTRYSDEERTHLMNEVLPARAAESP